MGGQASNATVPTLVQVFIEQLNDTSNMTLSINVYMMKFDISASQTRFETYFLVSNQSVSMYRDKFYSIPSIEIHCKLNRTNNTAIMPYEQIGTFSRIGLYIQELLLHRTVYSAGESHHPTIPGMQGINGGFSTISNIGTSSIPFLLLSLMAQGCLFQIPLEHHD